MQNSNWETVPVSLNIGGKHYCTTARTLMNLPENCEFTQPIRDRIEQIRNGRSPKEEIFLDADGKCFRFLLNLLRNGNLNLPRSFNEIGFLTAEMQKYGYSPQDIQEKTQFNNSKTNLTAEYCDKFDTLIQETTKINDTLLKNIGRNSTNEKKPSGHITVGYRGSFAFGRDGLADVKFRKLTKILVAGKVLLCRDVFGETLNESRDPDYCDENNRYTARFFLKHLSLEQAFDSLHDAGFHCVGSCGSGTSTVPANEPVKPGIDSEETRWNHYNEFVFHRP